MRLYTHSDLDGVMCAVLLSCVEEVDEFRFVDPGTVQAGKIQFTKNDIISDLPFDRRCGMWFDHHESSRPREGVKFEGEWKLAPSAARVIFGYYENPYLEKYRAAVEATDRIDSGAITREEAESPAGWFLFSNTLETSAEKIDDDRYREHAIALIRRNPDIEAVLADARVAQRVKNVKAELDKFAQILREHTVMIGKVAYSDLRARPDLPRGNNYLVYSLFPDAVTSVRIMPEKDDKESAKISVGHNIYGKKSEFDVGAAMKKIGGGGHRSVGGASVKKEDAEALARKIVADINEFEK
jgi:oligoribonuclease NrnB/cAMP/cGMP phosphodiesterase (DHH superfamily)